MKPNLSPDAQLMDRSVALARIEDAELVRFAAHAHQGGELEAHLIDIDHPEAFQIALMPDGTWYAIEAKETAT